VVTVRRLATVTQAALAAQALARLARGRERRDQLAEPAAAALAALPGVSVVIPARDEAARIAGVLEPLRGAPGVAEVIVVDDESADGTAAIAARLGARVVAGEPAPAGWVGKPWALQQGLEAASGELAVFLDADVRPDPALPAAIAGLVASAPPGGGPRVASAQLAFTCPDVAQRLLHPALLTTLVYRLGPLDTTLPVPPHEAALNGQCFAVRRQEMLAAGGFVGVASAPTDDIALARRLAARGWEVACVPAPGLGEVAMFASAREAWREWAGRSLALPGAVSRRRQLVDLAVVGAVQGAPGLALWRAVLEALVRRSPVAGVRTLRPLDAVLLLVRLALVGALGGTYRRGRRPDPVSLLAPLADPVAVAGLARGTLAPVRRWRGRDLPR